MDREALLERGQPLDLTGDKDSRVEQKRLSSLLDDLDSLGFEVVPGRWRKPQLSPGREDDLAFPPSLGMDHKREPPPPMPLEQRLQAAVMV
jgi:hypothetical protein